MSSKKAHKNKYVKKLAPLRAQVQGGLLGLFCADVTALSAASLTGLNRNTVNCYYVLLRVRIVEICRSDSEMEADENYFGTRRVRCVRGRAARGKIIVFDLLKRGGKVYTWIVLDVTRKTLMQVIEGRASKDSTMCTDGFSSYDGLADWGCKHRCRVSHGGTSSSRGVTRAATLTVSRTSGTTPRTDW